MLTHLQSQTFFLNSNLSTCNHVRHVEWYPISHITPTALKPPVTAWTLAELDSYGPGKTWAGDQVPEHQSSKWLSRPGKQVWPPPITKNFRSSKLISCGWHHKENAWQQCYLFVLSLSHSWNMHFPYYTHKNVKEIPGWTKSNKVRHF